MFPIVQEQWLNILLLNEFEFSYYSILYYISGFLFPILVINNSSYNFSNYNFNSNKYQSKKFKFVGSIVISTVLILSILIIRYFIFSINYIISQIDLNNYFDIKLQVLLSVIVMILLLINRTKIIIKKLLLLNYFIICFINWSIYFLNIQGIEIFINKYISSKNFYEFNNLNTINIFFLFIIEILYYIWSFISYKKNLSDWSITYPLKSDFTTLSKITIFYLGIFVYYIILDRIN